MKLFTGPAEYGRHMISSAGHPPWQEVGHNIL